MIILLLLLASTAQAGLPPIQSKNSGSLLTPATTSINFSTGLSASNSGGAVTVTAPLVSTPAQAISASSIDWSTGNMFKKTLAANTTFTFAGVSSGQTIIVNITNTASNWTVTWPAGVCWPGGATTCTGTAPVQTIGAHTDVYTFIYDNTNYYATAVQNF